MGIDHLIDRELTDYPWKVFHCGHYGWYYTNGNSVIQRDYYESRSDAQAAMEKLRASTN
jgi:hypothetical protein